MQITGFCQLFSLGFGSIKIMAHFNQFRAKCPHGRIFILGVDGRNHHHRSYVVPRRCIGDRLAVISG